MKYCIGVCCLVCLLSACSREAPSQQDYIRHPQKLEAMLQQCQDDMSSSCQEVRATKRLVQSFYHKIKTDPRFFGESLLQEQSNLEKLQARYRKDPVPALAQQIDDQQQGIRSKLAFLFLLDQAPRP